MNELTFAEIHIAPWDGANGLRSYSVIGLTKEGKVYRYDAKCDGWIPWSMTLADCGGHRR